ncbi:MAG: ABC transporter ATP-binding protein [Candidatus Marinimicrobia bacterium]|nr:ABC transporter ATP-binding protein [Candidatus Neomarinimicrobiota bacterium]
MTEVTTSSKLGELADFSEIDMTKGLKTQVTDLVNGFIIQDTKLETLATICIAIIVVFLIKNIAFYINLYMASLIELGVIRDIRNILYSHMVNLSFDYFNKSKVGTLISRLTNDVQVVNTAIVATFLNMIRDLLLLVLYLAIVLMISWKLTVIALSVTSVSVILMYFIGKMLRSQALLSQKLMANIISIIQETLSGMRLVKAFGMEKFEVDKFSRKSKEYHDVMRKVFVWRKTSSPVSEIVGIAAITVVLWFGGKQVIFAKSIEANDFIVYLFALFSMMQPLKAIGTHYIRIQEGLSAGERLFEIIDIVPKIVNPPNPIGITGIEQSIDFKSVNFNYGDGAILKDINISIKSGEILAIVGPSGAGKSTFANLIPRFYDTTSGEITIDGINLKDINLEDLRKLTGYVTQEVILFNDTVRNNIAYGREDKSKEAIIQAAKTANAHDFITNLPDGYSTFLGDRGTRLSGGQQQRVAIARAILNDPPILIFDEATSSLDLESEMKVQQAIENLMANRTVIMIAHRLSTVKKADKIIVLDNGSLVQEGTHKELIEEDGLYAKLYNLQFQV